MDKRGLGRRQGLTSPCRLDGVDRVRCGLCLADRPPGAMASASTSEHKKMRTGNKLDLVTASKASTSCSLSCGALLIGIFVTLGTLDASSG